MKNISIFILATLYATNAVAQKQPVVTDKTIPDFSDISAAKDCNKLGYNYFIRIDSKNVMCTMFHINGDGAIDIVDFLKNMKVVVPPKEKINE